MKKILVTGADFKNKGGQSMLYVTVSELRKRFPDCEILFPTDKDVDTNYRVTPVFYCLESLKYMHGGKDRAWAIVKGILKKCIGKKGTLGQIRQLNKIFPEIDVIIDISGYNLSSDWSEKINYKYLEYIRQAQKYSIPVYLMPQSFGPFEYKRNIHKMDQDIYTLLSYCQVVFAREKVGYDLLIEKYKLDNVKLSSDLVLQNKEIDLKNVFINPPKITTQILKTEGNVAIIPNMKNVEHGSKEKLLALYKSLIEMITKDGKTVYIFHHSGNDLELCKWIKELFMNDTNVVLINDEFTCLEYSQFIRQFDFVVASRYHAIVHALKEGIPCVALGWAVKYRELMSKFNMDEYVFDITKKFNEDDICKVTDKMCKDYEQLSTTIIRNLNKIQEDNCFDIFE